MSRYKSTMQQPLVLLSLALHVVWVCVFIVFVWTGSSHSPGWLLVALDWLGLPASGDAIAQAADLGRLDLVSLSLTILGAVLALAALASYFVMRHTVVQTTREEAEAAIPHEVKKSVTIERLIEAIKSDPVLLEHLRSAAREGAMTDKAADDIAASVGGENV
jgi:hypothetical protein